MKKLIQILIFIFAFNGFALGQDNIYFNFDYAVFKGENNQSILEIYYSINQKSLKYLKTDDKFEAAAKLFVRIVNLSKNSLIYEKSFKTPTVISDTSDKKLNQKLVGQLNFLLPDGTYKLDILGSDFNDSSKFDSFSPEIKIDNSSSSDLVISDIELANQIVKSSNEKSIFYKNTLEIIPNPSALFGMNLKELHYYYEIYGLTPENISDTYTITYNILNLNLESVFSEVKKFTRKNESKADFGKIPIDSLNRGSYILKITLTDSLKNKTISSEKKFFVFNLSDAPQIMYAQDDFLKSEFANMNEEQLEQEFNYSEYIMSQKEVDTYEKLKSINDKRKYLYSFWKSKDNNQSTPLIEYKIDYFKRVKEANKNFKESYKEGWKTDRGRIYIIYGKPDEIERFPFESESKAYEIWSYNSLQGGAQCVFIERQNSSNDYYLAHSTLRNELSNSNWKNDLK